MVPQNDLGGTVTVTTNGTFTLPVLKTVGLVLAIAAAVGRSVLSGFGVVALFRRLAVVTLNDHRVPREGSSYGSTLSASVGAGSRDFMNT